MVNNARAREARRALTALAAAGLGPGDVQQEAIQAVSRVVPYDATCWAAVDPQTMLLTDSVTIDLNPSAQQQALFAEIEYGSTESGTFADLARRDVPVARLSELPYGTVMASRRLNDLYRPMGVAHDLRVAFVSGGVCWGMAGLMRGPDGPDFSAAEADFLASVAPLIGAALRTAARCRVAGPGAGLGGPVVIVLGPDGQSRAATPAAREWMAAVQERRPDWLGIALRGLVITLSRSASGTAQSRIRDATGTWVLLRAAPLMDLDSSDERVLITVEPVPGDELTNLMLSAYALTPREREVCVEVLSGGSTAQIADRLHLSSYTVQDHLKSIFTKVGVRTRGELVGRLRDV
jgi:DNA-binding CsgD family transcriptional regulator